MRTTKVLIYHSYVHILVEIMPIFRRGRPLVIEVVPNSRSSFNESTISVRGDMERNVGMSGGRSIETPQNTKAHIKEPLHHFPGCGNKRTQLS